MKKTFTFSESNTRATCNGGCHKDKKVFSNEPLPKWGKHYWEVIKGHLRGCYDSVGVTSNYSLFPDRNGMKNDGWAVRPYGKHSDK